MEVRGGPPSTAKLSAARLSGLCFELTCDRAALSGWLARFGRLTLGGAGRRHTVLCELWNVHDGALCIGNSDQHELSERAGAAGAALARAMVAAWPSPRTKASVSSAVDRLVLLSRSWPELARNLSQGFARGVGTYRECMVWVPDVDLRGVPHSFVVGMLTDSPLARWADLAFGFGYDKRAGRFELGLDDAWTAFGPSGAEQIRFRREGSSPEARPAEIHRLDRWLAAPLLGVARGGKLVRSRLERSFESATAVRRVGGELAFSPGFVPGGLDRYEIDGKGSGGKSRAFAFSDMRARVGYPEPL